MNAVQKQMGACSSASKAWIFLGAFALLVVFTGGASRFDAIQIVPLRSLSCLMLIPAIYYFSLKEMRREWVLLALLGALALLTAVQLVPLPPSIWRALPGREVIVGLDEALGMEDVWRPLTMTPMRTWNALGALVVPVAGLLLAISLAASARVLLHVVAGLGVLNALLGLMQVASGRFSPLYLYEVTNRGGVVGIFANENHSGIFAACCMLVVAHLGIRSWTDRGHKWMRLIYPAAFVLILLAALVGGSRAGFAAALGAVFVSFGMFALAPSFGKGRSAGDPIRAWMDRHPAVTIVLPLIAVLMTVFSFVALGRSSAFVDLLARDSFADLRWELWPVLADMLSTFWLVGSGFGSFEQVYRVYEPAELLMPRYVNQAHNDWLQLLIEGGILSGALLVATLLWVAKSIWKLARVNSGRATALFWFGLFAIIGGASLVDYPLRTPLFQIVCVWLLLALSRDYRGHKAT
ncbi:O-antigen ligase family protein [Qipengyuania sp. 1XM1-15A]|uniref:O-antigen ligase family protein n=1 Tax=Qipengyuania xiamenensis TaxID=2867237 RepID=UPI001C8807F6|nr:O-antigen ligase family protein [Qipengyuania xiamenensis]MBX7531758.1 O-antigen ligase family protein [Qipengyuania xiamenensis]